MREYLYEIQKSSTPELLGQFYNIYLLVIIASLKWQIVFIDLNWFLRWAMWPMGLLFISSFVFCEELRGLSEISIGMKIYSLKLTIKTLIKHFGCVYHFRPRRYILKTSTETSNKVLYGDHISCTIRLQ